jgi:hypothetical protein
MGRDGSPAVDVRSNFGNGEVPATPLGNTREIGRGRAQGRSDRAIATARYTVTRAAMALIVLLSRTDRLAWDARQRLCRRQYHLYKCPP